MSVRLYVGNLPKDLEREELEAVFAVTGELTSTKLIVDRKTGKCRGFAFVTVPTDEQADRLIEQFNGSEFKESTLKIEKALPRKSKEEEGEGSSASGGGGGSKPRRSSGGGGGGKKARRSPGGSSEAAAAQPDPRWAGELEKLKQMLAAQTTSTN